MIHFDFVSMRISVLLHEISSVLFTFDLGSFSNDEELEIFLSCSLGHFSKLVPCIGLCRGLIATHGTARRLF